MPVTLSAVLSVSAAVATIGAPADAHTITAPAASSPCHWRHRAAVLVVVTTAATADFAVTDAAAEAVAVAVAVTAAVWQPSLRQLMLLLLRPSLGRHCDCGRLCSRHFNAAEDITVAVTAADAVAIAVAVTAAVDAAVAMAIATALDTSAT